jgi:hypothetical protein
LIQAINPPRPPYFEKVYGEVSRRWDQLEADPGLAAPWHQLFRQLLSEPRHVLSELLQNADDAGATWARATIADGIFRFEHNGKDFDEADFRSLCSFGLSNKRFLHTIGFRGIGFKTTFSLGPYVELFTPTLAVGFDEKCFTKPIWLDDTKPCECTVVQIQIDSPGKVAWLEKHLEN